MLISNKARPLQDNIYQRLRSEIENGRLNFGVRLPPVRQLAIDYSASRGTILGVLSRLTGEGFIETSRSAGSRVIFSGRATSTASHSSVVLSAEKLSLTPLALEPGLPALDEFPKKAWSRIVASESRRINNVSLSYPAAGGEDALKRSIASYLAISRSTICEPDQIVITSSFQSSVHLIRTLLLQEGDRVWVEDPGYRLITRYLRVSGIGIIPVPVDEDGLKVSEGLASGLDAKLSFVSPTHQFPLGHCMTDDRRRQLLDWAQANGTWIVEDDYDGEFHYGRGSIPSLKSKDHSDRVIFCGTFSKILFPSIRVAYVVFPRSLVRDASRLANIMYPAPSPLVQNSLTAFMVEGHFARHLSRMRRLYAQRREIMASAIESRFKASIAFKSRKRHALCSAR